MKLFPTVCLAMAMQMTPANVYANENVDRGLSALQAKQWIHGSQDCKNNTDPKIEVFQYDESSYILRQNKCLTYEAPFIYVLIGSKRTAVIDTGAIENAQESPLYETVQSLLKKHKVAKNSKHDILVLHTHSHSDHYAADSQFENQENVTVIGTSADEIASFYRFDNENQQTMIDLGERELQVMLTPGHQEEAIGIYDPKTKWLLTGDSFYPGVIYVKDWDDYRESIAKLAKFISTYPVSAVMGTHIEMKQGTGQYYDIGSTYQPHEAPLPLSPNDLLALNSELSKNSEPTTISLPTLVVEPLGAFPKLLSNIASWFM